MLLAEPLALQLVAQLRIDRLFVRELVIGAHFVGHAQRRESRAHRHVDDLRLAARQRVREQLCELPVRRSGVVDERADVRRCSGCGGTEQAGSAVGRSSSTDNCCSRSRTEVKYSSRRARSDAESSCTRSLRCSATPLSTLRRIIVAGSGVNVAEFGSLNSGPKMRVYSASGETSAGFMPFAPRALHVDLRSPSHPTSSERKRATLVEVRADDGVEARRVVAAGARHDAGHLALRAGVVVLVDLAVEEHLQPLNRFSLDLIGSSAAMCSGNVNFVPVGLRLPVVRRQAEAVEPGAEDRRQRLAGGGVRSAAASSGSTPGSAARRSRRCRPACRAAPDVDSIARVHSSLDLRRYWSPCLPFCAVVTASLAFSGVFAAGTAKNSGLSRHATDQARAISRRPGRARDCSFREPLALLGGGHALAVPYENARLIRQPVVAGSSVRTCASCCEPLNCLAVERAARIDRRRRSPACGSRRRSKVLERRGPSDR